MKKRCLLLAICAFASIIVCAAPMYWVGPFNGNWNNSANWSATSNGPGGAGVPGNQDSVIINHNAVINLDVSPFIQALRITSGSNATLYTSIPTTFTITSVLDIETQNLTSVFTSLTDSTSADVPFNFIFNAATNARARILGHWIFEGGVPVSNGNGPTFTAPPGTSVALFAPFPDSGLGGSILLRGNTTDITSNPSTLSFSHNASFVLDNPVGAIPNAFWEGERVVPRYISYRASSILITGNLTGELRHLSDSPVYGSLTVNLTGLAADASLALPHGTLLKGNLNILHTNYKTLTLLAATGPSDSVTVTVGIVTNPVVLSGGFVSMSAYSGNNTMVALARATDAAPATTYRLQVNQTFNQDGGNFSLQEYDGATGSSTLAIKGNFGQNRGTFFTNSTATGPGAKFVVEMDAPPQFANESGIINTLRRILISSETIDNGRNMVTLRIRHAGVFQPTGAVVPYGVVLDRPLAVGRLELLSGPLTTEAGSYITINDPDVNTALQVGFGYVNGLVRRRTNSTNAYVFPTGRGNSPPAPTVSAPIEVIPASDEPSMYQAEYFNTRYNDIQNLKLPLTGVSTTEYWNISKVSGSDAKVKLTVRDRVRNAAPGDVLVVARYAAGQWVSEEGTKLSPGNTNTGSVTSKTLSGFGPFTFGYYPYTDVTPVFVNCPADTTINNDLGKCSALFHFKAETSENATVTYRIGSTVITSPYQFPKGVSVVEVVATTASGTANCSFTITVKDNEAPIIYGPLANPASLSPADDEFRQVHISYTPDDNCGTVTSTLSIETNQPQNGAIDWEIIDYHSVRLRASASGEDRVYTITITAVDEAGNKSVEKVTVKVPAERSDKMKLKVKVMNNPTKNAFTLQVSSNSNMPIIMQVFDIFGRVKEVRRFYADATIRIGENYRPGVYFVKLTQGKEEVYLPLLKLP